MADLTYTGNDSAGSVDVAGRVFPPGLPVDRFVQQAIITTDTLVSPFRLDAVFHTPPKAGNTLVAVAFDFNTTVAPTGVPVGCATWTSIQTQEGSVIDGYMWLGTNITGNSNTVTVTFSGTAASSGWAFAVYEFEGEMSSLGATSAGILDVNGQDTLTVTPTATPAVLFGAFAHGQQVTTGSGARNAFRPTRPFQQFRDAILATAPWGYWRMNEESGTFFADASGQGQLLVAYLGSSWSNISNFWSNTSADNACPETAAMASYMSGLNAYGAKPYSPSPVILQPNGVDKRNPMTMGFLFAPTFLSTTSGIASDGVQWGLELTNANKIGLNIRTGASTYTLFSESGVSFGYGNSGTNNSSGNPSYRYVVVRFDGLNRWRVTVNGVTLIDVTQAPYFPPGTTNSDLNFGRSHYVSAGTGLGGGGQMSNAAFWTRELSDAEVENLTFRYQFRRLPRYSFRAGAGVPGVGYTSVEPFYIGRGLAPGALRARADFDTNVSTSDDGVGLLVALKLSGMSPSDTAGTVDTVQVSSAEMGRSDESGMADEAWVNFVIHRLGIYDTAGSTDQVIPKSLKFTFTDAAGATDTVAPRRAMIRTGIGQFSFTSDVADAVNEPARTFVWASGDVSYLAFTTHADADARVTPEPLPDGIEYRSDLSLTLEMPEPAIVNGQPFLPDFGWAKVGADFAADSGQGTYLVTKPPPPVPNILTRPPGASYDHLVWRAASLGADGSQPTAWPADPTWGEWSGARPAWASNSFYAPTVNTRSVYSSAGTLALQDKAVVFNYKQVEHMWIDLGLNITGGFTWILCGIILSYPTARYGHYLIDHGHNPGRNLYTYGFNSKVSGEGGHRSAMLFQRHSALVGTTYPTIQDGPYARSQHNYTPQPRMFYGIFNGASSYSGVRGRNYSRSGKGKVLSATHRNFVTGRRNGYTSTDLASHMAVFEIHFFKRALGTKDLDDQYNALSARFDFSKYKV